MELTDERRVEAMSFATDHEGHAQATLVMYPGLFRHNKANDWLVWTGTHWKTEGADQSVVRAVTNTLNFRRQNFAAREDFAKAKECKVYHNSVRGIMAQIAKTNSVYTPPSWFDQSPDHVNCANGVLDLRTGELSAHKSDNLYTYCLPVAYRADAPPAYAWLEFLESIQLDAEIVDYLQIALGYTLTGHTSDEVMFYLYGPGRSGKGTFTETVSRILGPLGTGVDMGMFTAPRTGNDQNFDLAPLKHMRFITASESQRQGALNAAVIKRITGGDEIRAAFKRRDSFSYRPQFKIWLTSNHAVNVDVDDDAAWGRVRVIGFLKSFMGKEDKTLKRRLASDENLERIFAWIVAGAQKWYGNGQHGLPLPDAVREAGAAHREALDSTKQYIDMHCEEGHDKYVLGVQLYHAYKLWCEEEGYTPYGRKRFTASLASKGIKSGVKRVAGKSQRVYFGIDFVFNGLEL